jgi:hypothetical protein
MLSMTVIKLISSRWEEKEEWGKSFAYTHTQPNIHTNTHTTTQIHKTRERESLKLFTHVH